MSNTTITRAARRIADCRNITPDQLVAADKAVRANAASVLRHPLVRDVSDERGMEDGVWVYLADGWTCPSSDCNSIHEDTWSDCVACLRGAYFQRAEMDDKEADAR